MPAKDKVMYESDINIDDIDGGGADGGGFEQVGDTRRSGGARHPEMRQPETRQPEMFQPAVRQSEARQPAVRHLETRQPVMRQSARQPPAEQPPAGQPPAAAPLREQRSGNAGRVDVAGATPHKTWRPIFMALMIIVVSLLTLGALSYGGVRIPYFTAIFDGLLRQTADHSAGGSAAGSAGARTTAGTAQAPAAGAANEYATPGSGGGAPASGGVNSWEGGVSSELMGSGGAWDGETIRMPSISISYDINEETEFRLYKNYLAECSRDSFYLIDREGAEAFRKSVDFIQPAMYICGEYLLVCDCGGRSAFAMKGAKLVWENTYSDDIVNASINKNGYAAFVLDATGYRNNVKILAPTGKTLFDWVVAEDYVIGAEVAPSGKELFVNRLKTAGINLCSGLEYLDMQSEPFMTIESGEDEVFLGARYLDNNSLAIVTENVFMLYSERGERLIRQEFDSIMAMCEFPPKKATVAVQQNNRSLVKEYGADTPGGRVLYMAERPIANMSADNGFLFINLGHEIAVIKENGDPASWLTLDAEAQYGSASEKFGVLVVTKKSADVYEF